MHHKPMPIFPDCSKFSSQKLKQNKSRYSQKLIKSTGHSLKKYKNLPLFQVTPQTKNQM